MMNIKQFTKDAAFQLQDDNLALTLQLWAESLMRVVVFVYVAGLIAGEVVRPYLTQLGEAFTYKITRSRVMSRTQFRKTLSMWRQSTDDYNNNAKRYDW